MIDPTTSYFGVQAGDIEAAAQETRAVRQANRWRLAAVLLLTLDVAAVTAWVLIAAVRP